MVMPSDERPKISKSKQFVIFAGVFIVGFLILASVGYLTNSDNSKESQIIKNKVTMWELKVERCKLPMSDVDELSEFIEGIRILTGVTKTDIRLYVDDSHQSYIDEIKKNVDLVTACIIEKKSQFGIE